MRRETRLVHFGRTKMPGPANPPVIRASTILHNTVESYRDTKSRREHDPNVLSYGRRGTTTAFELANAITDLEGGDATFLFPSGVAAITTAISAFACSGDHVLVVDTVFGATRKFCDTQFKQMGVEVDYFPWETTDLGKWVKPATKLVFVESPASLTYEIMDLRKLCASAKELGLIVIADNTYGSSWLHHPLELGCDVSIIAGTKYLCGHADVMMGAACAKGDACGPLRDLVLVSGQTLSPDDAYAVLRGMRTLGLRLERHGTTSTELANWFLQRPEVETVLHPGLENHPGYINWQNDATGCNGLLTVGFKLGFDTDNFLNQLSLFSIGSSWGGYESLAMPIDSNLPRLFESISNTGPMVRFHAGLEHIDDLKDDLSAAFNAVPHDS